ncbi:4Fe-4S dicluster domain-containing protein [Desulfonispora thiosulfatigenes DSM 11270]|uniref:4Fe-4S dicluster domain-containing protein n=1 Tax=Desulfonispora thiosulfatigenes DSM 11270 TaxID=656914 RepID=A0A1W1VSZ8_DESTI|nr:4Fe-4S dicluster domain-containing protein [Desulfonispora thiosulfatigenes]SMB96478.1 4Fe-4S dicluster domain-containing protein [Desulfonispora thiosulfatigenes DSM 11270]
MKTINKSNLAEFLGLLSQDYRVLVPAKFENTTKFTPYTKEVNLELDNNVIMPPKDILFPNTEKMYTFKAINKTVEIFEMPKDATKQIVFGARSCDMKSVDCLDQVFLTKGFTDDFYKDKKDRSIFIALACNKSGKACFCESMGIDPQKAVLADIQSYDLGDKFGFEAVTDAGKEVLNKASKLLAEEKATVPKFEGCNLKADIDGVPEKLKGMFSHPMWEDVSRKCLNCNACAYVCPTCHCFDISQETKGEDGCKIRCWDSCMSGEYTMMAAPHQPRPGKTERVRNRFMHKLNYFVDRYDMLLCVGCGRCVEVCPVNLDITSIIKKAKEAV